MTIQNRFRITTIIVPVVLLLGLAPAFAAKSAPADPIQKEIELGKEAMKDVEKDCKLVKDEAVLARVRKIGAKVAAVAQSEEFPAAYGDDSPAPFDYTFKVIEDKSVNAFSLPGGIIYVHTGLLDFVQSDDELAAVLAHEVAHAAHHHMKSLLRAQSKLQSQLALLLVAGLLGNIPQRDLSNVMLGTQFYKIARLNGYGQQAERDADLTALSYLTKTDYNPVGMLTFLERLAQRPELVQLGIFQNHPHVDDRVTSVLGFLDDHHIAINRRSVTNSAKLGVREVQTDSGPVMEVVVGEKAVVRLSGDKSRAEEFADSVNADLDDGLEMKDILVSEGGSEVILKGTALIQVSEDDASANGLSRLQTARQISDSIRRIVWQEMLEFRH